MGLRGRYSPPQSSISFHNTYEKLDVVMNLSSNIKIASIVILSSIFGIGCSNEAAEHNQLPSISPISKIGRLQEQLDSPSSDQIMVVAHRGCWRETAENSIAAVETCIENNIDMIEVDVYQTIDGHLVSIHDKTVDRTTDGTGDVSSFTLEEIRLLKLKSGAGGSDAEITDWQVPLLEEMLLAAKNQILINLDVKEAIYGQSLELVEALEMTDQVLIKMVALPDDERLTGAAFLGKTYFMPIVRQCRPEKQGMICSKDLSDVLPDYEKFSPIAYEVVFHEEEYLIDGVDEIKKQNKRLWVNTLQKHHAAGHMDLESVADPDNHWGHLINIGADIIQTDNPIELATYLDSKGLR